jgi:hypothetical protein
MECASMIDALIQVKDEGGIRSRPSVLHAMYTAGRLAMLGNCDPEIRAKIEATGDYSFTEVGGDEDDDDDDDDDDEEETLPDPVDMNEHLGKTKPKYINRFGGPPSLN